MRRCSTTCVLFEESRCSPRTLTGLCGILQGGLTTATEYMAAGAGMQHNPKPPGARVDPTQQDGTNAAIMGNQMLDVIRML